MIRIDGTIDNIERTSRVDAFQTDKSFSVFLLTTQVWSLSYYHTNSSLYTR